MISFAPAPIFTGTWDHRPSVPSPLASSSPVRASSPLSPIDQNAQSARHTQSSPLQPSKFKFASRPTRPNPVQRKREEAQDSRRRLFLQNVRHKREDKAWQRRDIEGQFLKSNYLANEFDLVRDAPVFSEADIEEAMSFHNEQPEQPEQPEVPEDDDDMMMDDIMEDEQLEAMFASYEEQQSSSQRPPSPASSDQDYDDVFAELIAREQLGQSLPQSVPEHMDSTDGNVEMTL